MIGYVPIRQERVRETESMRHKEIIGYVPIEKTARETETEKEKRQKRDTGRG